MSRAGSWLLLLVLLFVGVAQAQSADTDTIEVPPDIGEFGLRYPTDEELQAAGKYTAEVLRVLPNDLAIERIKEEKDPSELYDLSLPRGVKKGEEYVFKNGSAEEGGIGTLDFPPGSLPASVDNSTSPAFPPIRSQGGLNSCAAWSTGYYIHTYEYARAKGLVASSGDNSVISSPKFIYNLVNGGDNVGSWPSGNLNLISVVGIPPWSSLPYDADYQSVPSGTAIWRAALQRKSYPFVGSLSDPSGDLTAEALINIKTLLANGSIAEVSVNINSWHTRQVRNDPGTSDDDPFFNQLITSYSDNRNLGGHSMTVVGYNDAIWNDINGNGIVEVAEKGAFKIANSWGVWGNSGFIWVSYDAMRSTTQVPATASWPPSDRGLFGFQWGRLEFQFLMINPDYKPQIIADLDFTSNKVRHVGVSTVATKAGGALVQRGIPMLSNVNGGNSSSLDSVKSLSMALDMTDLILFGEQDLPTKWGMNFVNSSIAGATTTLSRFELFQRQGASYVSRALAAGLPKTLTTAYQSDTRQIDWTFIPLGQRPTAQLVAPATADINSTILLDASGSSDTEGALYGYRYVVDGAFSTLLPSSSMSFVWQYPVIAYGSPLAARMQAIDLDGNVRTDNKNIIRQAAGGGNTPTPTTTPTRTPTLTATPVPPTITPTRTATANPTATQSSTATPTRTVTPSGTLTSTPSPTMTVTRTPTPSVSTTATGTPTSTPTDTPTGTPQSAPTLTPTREPTPTATVTQNPTEEPVSTPTAIPDVKKLRPPKIKVSGNTVLVTMKSGGERYSISVKSRACGIRRLASRRNVVRIAPPNTGGKLTYQMFSSGILTGESIKAVSLPRPDQAEQRPRTSQCSLKVGSRSR